MDLIDQDGFLCQLDKPFPFKSLPNNTILGWSKLKAFADINLNVAQMKQFVFNGIENVVEKGENAG